MMPRAKRRKTTDREWMRPTDAAKVLGVKRQTVMYRVGKGEYRTTEIGGITFVSRRDVEKAAAAKAAA